MAEKYYIKNSEGDFVEAQAVSQETLDYTLKERLKREREKFADYEELKSKVQSAEDIRSEYEEKIDKIKSQYNDSESKLSQLQNEIDRQKVFREFGISEGLEKFISGDSYEDMRAKAEELTQAVKNSSSVSVEKTERPEGDPDVARSVAKQLFGKTDD